MTASYVYRLAIEYPEVDYHHPPDAWVCDMQDWGREGEWFSWPQERRFLSRSNGHPSESSAAGTEGSL